MLSSMRNKRRKFVPPCNYETCSCYCHKPESPEYQAKEKEASIHNAKIIAFVLIFLALWIGGLAWYSSRFTEQPRHIQVNGQDCIVHTVYYNCNSTGSCQSYDEAVCPK